MRENQRSARRWSSRSAVLAWTISDAADGRQASPGCRPPGNRVTTELLGQLGLMPAT